MDVEHGVDDVMDGRRQGRTKLQIQYILQLSTISAVLLTLLTAHTHTHTSFYITQIKQSKNNL
jgi:hypothetical protein